MILRAIYLFMAGLLLILSSCTTEHSKIVLAEYGDYSITMSEFEKAYAKNTGGYENAKNDSLSKMKNFLNLYLNFKMKLRDALVRSYDKDPALVAELNDYKEKVGVTYLLEKKLVEPSLKELYERRKWEYRASHIMLRTGQGTDEDQRKLAYAIFDSIKTGASFEEMAMKHSQDQFSAPMGGDLFYLTAGLLPIEFEDAVYKTEPGQIYTDVLQTKFGYHIIKVTEKRERVPSVQASHILIDYKNEAGELDTLAAKAKVDSILAAARGGEDFSSLALQFSEDPGSKEKGGDLGFFERRMMVQEFDETAFNLEVGQVSDVVRTNFGLHVIKVTEKEAYPTFEADRENLKNLLKRSRYNDLYAELIENYKKEFNYSVNENSLQQMVGYNDSTVIGGEMNGLSEIGGNTVFSFTNHTETVNDFYSKIKSDTEFSGKKFTSDVLNKGVKKISEQLLIEEKALSLEKTDAQFADLMKDYQNGIFIFKLQEEEVWNKVSVDSVKLYDFYQKNMQKYSWPDRVAYTEIYSKKDSVIKSYYSLLKSGENFDVLAANTERSQVKDKAGKYDLQAVGSTEFSKIVNNLSNIGDYTEPVPNPGGFSILRLDLKDPARLKTFEEAKPEVSGAYQEYESKRLENEYIDSLKKKYSPVIYYDELRNAFKQNVN